MIKVKTKYPNYSMYNVKCSSIETYTIHTHIYILYDFYAIDAVNQIDYLVKPLRVHMLRIRIVYFRFELYAFRFGIYCIKINRFCLYYVNNIFNPIVFIQLYHHNIFRNFKTQRWPYPCYMKKTIGNTVCNEYKENGIERVVDYS